MEDSTEPYEAKMPTHETLNRRIGERTLVEINKIRESIDWVEPRQYQIEALSALQAARDNDEKAALLYMATGLGKTTVAALDIATYMDEKSRANYPTPKILFLANQKELIAQAAQQFTKFFPNHNIATTKNKQTIDHSADILCATLQKMEGSKLEFDRNAFDYVIVDESHHSMAPHYSSTISYFEPEFRLGITATPFRSDEQDLSQLFGKTVYEKSLAKAMAEDLLSMPDYRMQVDEVLGSVLQSEFKSIQDLNEALFIKRRNEEIANIILETEKELVKPKGIIFCSDIEHAERMSSLIPESQLLHSRMPKNEQEQSINSFKYGDLKTILTVDMFNEGVDIPEANLLVFLRSTSSRIVFEQQLGRGLRKTESKDKVVVLDFVGNCEKILTLFELSEEIKTEYQKKLISDGVSDQEVERKTSEFMTRIGFTFTRQDIDIIQYIKKMTAVFELAPVEYISLANLANSLGVVKTTVQKAASDLGIDGTIMLSTNGRTSPHFSPDQVERIDAKLNILEKAPEDWISPTGFEQQYGVDASAVRSAARQLGIEGKIMLSANRRKATFYNPEDQIRLFDQLTKPFTLKDSWKNLETLSKELPISRPTIQTIVESLGIVGEEMKNSHGRISIYYPPETAELIKSEYDKVPYPPEDWVSMASIRNRLGVNERRVKNAEIKTGIQGSMLRSSIGKPAMFYSPDDASRLEQEIIKNLVNRSQ